MGAWAGSWFNVRIVVRSNIQMPAVNATAQNCFKNNQIAGCELECLTLK